MTLSTVTERGLHPRKPAPRAPPALWAFSPPLSHPWGQGHSPGAGLPPSGQQWQPALLLPSSPERLSISPAPHHSPPFPSQAVCLPFPRPRGPTRTLGGVSVSGRTQDGGFGLGPGPSEVGSEFWRMTAPRVPGAAVGVGTAGSGSWEAGKAARFRVGWSCRDWDRGTGAAYGFSGTRCATRLCRERPGRVGCPL